MYVPDPIKIVGLITHLLQLLCTLIVRINGEPSIAKEERTKGNVTRGSLRGIVERLANSVKRTLRTLKRMKKMNSDGYD